MMQKMHIHLPERMHMHKPDWPATRIHLKHLVRDPRFWATLALVILFGLMILTTILSKGAGSINTKMTYPYNPYWP